MSAFSGTLISSKSRDYLLKDRHQVGQSASRSVRVSRWTVLIGRTEFGTMFSIPDSALSSNSFASQLNLSRFGHKVHRELP